jgi:cell division transport system permease protein
MILAVVDIDMPDHEAKSLGTQLSQVEYVYNAKFVSREDALNAFVEEQGGDPIFSGVDPEDLRHRYQITLMDNSDLKAAMAEIAQIEGIAEVRAEEELATTFAAIQDILQIASIVVIVGLLAISLVIISNTVKIAMHERRDEIAIMKMVGATNGFIRLPFVVEGFVLGMTGAGLAFAVEWALYDAVAAELAVIEGLEKFQLVPYTDMLLPTIVTFLGAGMFVGVVGSWTSIRKFMDV